MSGYKRVNYYELCRLCTSTEGTKIHIFKEEGRRRQLPTKIKRCLPLKIFDYDLLPKMICHSCIVRLEEIDNFRQLSIEAEKMLQDFRSTLKNAVGGSDGKLQVYVKDSQSQMIETTTSPSCESPVRSNNPSRGSSTEYELDNKIVAHVNIPNGVLDETRQLPLQCTVPLKLNGTTTSVVPLNVENISSLMQVLPDDELSRIQQFKLPLQTEMAVVSEQNGGSFSVTLPAMEAISKESANVIQSLQCAVNDEGNIEIHKLGLQSNIAASNVSFNDSVAVSLISSSPTNINIQDVISQVSLTKDESTIKSCTHCGKILTNPNETCNHTIVRPATTAVSPGCEMTPTTVKQSIAPKMKQYFSESNGYVCDICLKPFRKKEHLLQHRKLHSGDRPYVCGSCGKSFSRKEHLFRHVLAHTGEKRHSCDFCGKTFSRKDNLHKHRKIHGLNGPYECELCGKSFIVEHYFLMHKANHSKTDSEEFPFQCNICKKGFLKEVFLNRHKVRHRARNPSQPEETNLTTMNSVDLLSAGLVQPNICIDESVYTSTQPATYSITTSVASNSTIATQTPFSSDLTTDGQLLDSFRQLNSTVISS